MFNYRWKFRERPNEETVNKLINDLKIPRTLAKVLVSRGFESDLEIRQFFDPAIEDIHNPFLMNDMDIAVDRILDAIKKSELIWIHGDYDVDGTSSTAMMLQFLRSIGARVDYHIPDRFQEGYGLTRSNVDIAHQKNVALILTVDVGITSVDALQYAKDLGMDAIICDHHEPSEELPPAVAILDPFIPGSTYPFRYLAACGVAFKLIQALGITLGIEDRAFSFLDLVAVASAADMVPMIGENRVLVSKGLEMLNKEPRPGIKGLLYCTNLKQGHITTAGIVYALAPLINAAGRLGDACRSVEMMSQDCEIQAFQMAQQLEQENRRRRLFDEETFAQAIPLAEKWLSENNRKTIVLHGPNWHAGVIGIVASRLVDRFRLPTVLLTTMYNMAKGSARSIVNFDIHSALKQCSHLLTEFGGHKHAAGLSLKPENLPEFSEMFDAIAHNNISDEMLEAELLIDSELNLFELSPNFMINLHKFAPFGFENYKPIFISKNITSKNGIKIVGNNHLKFRALQHHPDHPENNNLRFEIDAIAHGLADKIEHCNNGKKFSILYNLEEYNYNGHTSIQLRIRDIRPDTLDDELQQ